MYKTKKIHNIALGTWSWGVGPVGGNEVFGNYLGTEELKPVFEAAVKEGITLWDTAFVYGMGASEEVLGNLIKGHTENVVLSTKFTPQVANNSENPVAEMLEGSLHRLGKNSIDIYWIHNPADVEKWTPYLIPLVQTGKVKRIGVSNHNLAQIKRAEEILSKRGVHISAVQNHYSLLYRSSEDAGILEYCKENEIEFFAYMVMEQGALSGKYNVKNPMPKGSQRASTYNTMLMQIEPLIQAMEEIGNRYQISISQVAIAWAISKGTIPIIGVTKPQHVESAAKAAEILLTVEEMRQLENAAKATGADTRGAWEMPMI